MVPEMRRTCVPSGKHYAAAVAQLTNSNFKKNPVHIEFVTKSCSLCYYESVGNSCPLEFQCFHIAQAVIPQFKPNSNEQGCIAHRFKS